MNRTRKLLVSTMIAAAGAVSTALTLSGTAAADPATPAPPVNPGAELLTQLSNVQAAAPQLMQSIASAMSGAQATPATPATPAAPAPGATASMTLPQLPELPTAATPAAAAAPATAPAALRPTWFRRSSRQLPAPTCQHRRSGPVAPERDFVARPEPRPAAAAPAAAAPAAIAPLAAAPAARDSARRCSTRGGIGPAERGRPCARVGAQRLAVTPEDDRTPPSLGRTMSPTRKLFANAAVAVGSSAALLLGMTGTANAEPASPLPIDAIAGAGHVGGGEPQPGDSEGGRRSVQRGVDADGGRGGVHRKLGGTRGLEERGVGGQRASSPNPRRRMCPHRVRCRAPRRTCPRASTRPMPSDRCRKPLPAPAPEAAPAPAPDAAPHGTGACPRR